MDESIHFFSNLPISRWEEYKKLYIDAATKEPLAFTETIEELVNLKDDEWKNELEEAQTGKGILLFAEAGGIPIGMGAATIRQEEKLSHNAFLTSLYVAEGFRGNGVGKMLIEKRIELLKTKGIHNIFCEIVETQETSIALHKKLGFKIIGELENFYKNDGKLYREYLLHLAL